MFSFVPTTKPANDSRSTFLGVFVIFDFHVVFECLRFFLSISYYTGSLWLTSFCISTAFFLPDRIFIIIFDLVSVCSYLQRLMVFMSLQKFKTLAQIWQHTFLLNIWQSVNVLFQKQALGHQYIIWYILFVILPSNLKKTPNDQHVVQNVSTQCTLKPAIPSEIPSHLFVDYPISLRDSSISCDSLKYGNCDIIIIIIIIVYVINIINIIRNVIALSYHCNYCFCFYYYYNYYYYYCYYCYY